MGKYDFILNCQKCNRTLWFEYYKLPDGKTVCPICYKKYEKPSREKEDDALKVLKLRYAKGEITKKEFEQTKKDLE